MAGAAALRGFVFVMREEQIGAACVNVYAKFRIAAIKMRQNHRDALAVPTGAPFTKRAIKPILIKFPQHEVLFVVLGIVRSDAGNVFAGDLFFAAKA